MKRALLALLMAFSVAAHAQRAPDGAEDAPYKGYAGPYGEKHVQKKRLERIAIGLRVQQLQRVASDRKEVQYAENRRRCQAALQVAQLCGKFAGTFYCDEKGFQPIAAGARAKPVAMNNGSRYTMERCALDAARHNP